MDLLTYRESLGLKPLSDNYTIKEAIEYNNTITARLKSKQPVQETIVLDEIDRAIIKSLNRLFF